MQKQKEENIKKTSRICLHTVNSVLNGKVGKWVSSNRSSSSSNSSSTSRSSNRRSNNNCSNQSNRFATRIISIADGSTVCAIEFCELIRIRIGIFPYDCLLGSVSIRKTLSVRDIGSLHARIVRVHSIWWPVWNTLFFFYYCSSCFQCFLSFSLSFLLLGCFICRTANWTCLPSQNGICNIGYNAKTSAFVIRWRDEENENRYTSMQCNCGLIPSIHTAVDKRSRW